MSAESGIPTFRSGPNALWRSRRPEELATPEAFARDPELVWAWYFERIATLKNAQPNAGHIALVRIASVVPNFSLVTQNVDGLHAAAGSVTPIELHGNIRRARCVRCAKISDATTIRLNPGADRQHLPHCACGGLLRPDVVWFGEALPQVAFERAQSDAMEADVFLTVGTSAVVYPAAGLVGMAKAAGAYLVEVNPDETDASAVCDVSVRAKAGEFLPLVADSLEATKGSRP